MTTGVSNVTGRSSPLERKNSNKNQFNKFSLCVKIMCFMVFVSFICYSFNDGRSVGNEGRLLRDIERYTNDTNLFLIAMRNIPSD